MAFDINAFYIELDELYKKFDNEATEKFLLGRLSQVEDSMIILDSSSCGCGHNDCSSDDSATKLSDEEIKWMLDCSDARIAVLNEIACFYRGQSRWEECRKAFSNVREEMEDRGMTDTDSYAVVILNMAGAYRLMGKFTQALDLFSESKKIMDSNGRADDYSYAGLLNNTGLVYQDLKEYEMALEYFEKSIEYLKNVPDNDAELATNLSNLSVAYYNAGIIDKAITSLDSATDLFESIDGGMNPHYAGTLNTKAFMLYNSGDIMKAAELFESAAEKTKLIFGENKEYAIGCRNCAYAYAKLGDTDKADKYNKLAENVEAGIK